MATRSCIPGGCESFTHRGSDKFGGRASTGKTRKRDEPQLRTNANATAKYTCGPFPDIRHLGMLGSPGIERRLVQRRYRVHCLGATRSASCCFRKMQKAQLAPVYDIVSQVHPMHVFCLYSRHTEYAVAPCLSFDGLVISGIENGRMRRRCAYNVS